MSHGRWTLAALCFALAGAGRAQDASLELKNGGVEFSDGSVQTSALPHRAAVEKTGQTGCYASDGTPRACAGSGEDGEFQIGVGSPSPRFVDHGDGTVTDLLTGLMWLKDADCDDPSGASWSNWETILAWVDDFNAGSMMECAEYVAGTYTDWRLPSVRELASVIDYGQVDPALPAGHPFVNVPWDTDGNFSYGFASSSVIPSLPTADKFWVVSSRDGQIRGNDGDLESPGAQAIWPVRGTTQGTVRVEDSGYRSDQCYASGGAPTPCTGTGQDAELQAGVAWPTPRFTDHGDGTVTDELTGLMWLKDRLCLGDGLTWQEALDSVTDFNTTAVACAEYTPQTHTDWRMANIKELDSLGAPAGTLPNDHPFPSSGADPHSYCSSTSVVGEPSQYWRIRFGGNTHINIDAKSNSFCRAWPVRGGVD